MSMRIPRLPTHLQPEEAHTLLELIDRLREELTFHYADDIVTMLKQASPGGIDDDSEL
ncbi:hypothetical protein [Dyella sp. M7H15-1]|uniref:hypothetical protein n=1 Tax=Dyella sp. M7H15-1 TaxID=2501295 RepID=UPI0013E8B1FE|nr:hypothetical protein [Dyella sp. M7H15-1]